MPELPTGTVTFLYTDLEGSTRPWEERPAAMKEAVARHLAILREAIGAHDGRVFRTTGDGLCAAFATAPDALAAALAAQRMLVAEPWGATGPLRARMALHTGAAEVSAGDYVGACMNRIGRLRDVAYGGQVLVSQATADLARGALPADAGLDDLGTHRLRDLVQPEHIFQFRHPDLPATFPPLRSLGAYPHNLPAQVTSFVGRDRELAEVLRLLRSRRLVTLTGAGGAGKTRLALQAAAELCDRYADGVWLVELAALTDPGLVPLSVATALSIREEPGHPIQTTLVDSLRSRHLLLVLDGCEHLRDACAHLADALLRACPRVQILATSREGLAVAGEVNWAVPSLGIPPRSELPPVERLARYDAVRLFVDRARAALPEFVLTDRNARAVAQICARLDGLPLAIELAAARVKGLSVDQLAARLDQRFRILTGGSRGALPRHQTLRAAVDWSYDLLDEQERLLFHRLSVFAGGFSLEAAEAVGADGERGTGDVLDVLTRLVNKSLVVAETSDDEAARYRLIETLRYYARERLAASGEAEIIYRRHAQHFLELAEEASAALRGPKQGYWLRRLQQEHDNLRAALEWWTSTGEAEPGLRLAGALDLFWFMRGHCAEGLSHLLELLALPGPSNGPERSEAWARTRSNGLYGAAYLAYTLGDLPRARALREESLAIGRKIGDNRIIAYALRGLAASAAARGDYPSARAQYEKSLELFRALGDRAGVAYAHYRLGLIAFAEGNYPRARPAFAESLAIARQDHDAASVARCLNRLGLVAFLEGDHATARARFQQALAIADDLGFAHGIGVSLRGLAWLALDLGHYESAQEQLRGSLRFHRKLGMAAEVASALEGLAGVAAGMGQPERALRLAGAAAAKRCDLGRPLEPALRAVVERWLTPARQALGESAAVAAWAEGRAMTLEQAIADALGENGS